ncbi:hypothetical protein NA57DRAFT_81240 [Rhizodiscina lignyota]|uniref:Uncharacterized protein n=1 Tax=Rhizodiscina lignyota TaxID=1504668 RepID=A0A9P4I598_9PEZI|nr:hypothetical protein NA57DRAFT_81240 [Rhizodiscina lignyota]
MTHSKTPGGQAMSAKAAKKDAQAHGLGADNAPAHKEGHAPGEAPVASDSYNSNVGVDTRTNQPGERGDVGVTVGEKPGMGMNQGNMK